METDDLTGTTLDNKYRLTTLLGKGGMGAVYRGEHMIIGKQVAVKFLHAELACNEEAVKRFYREAQAAAAIEHDSIIDVMDVGVSPNGEPYLVMEYLEGESLADLLSRSGPLDLSAVCGIMEPALLALQAAHAKNIVHRDLKPDNIFLAHKPGGPPKIKLIDFGISKFSTNVNAEKLTQTGSVMGTPADMAPEQARGSADLDHRADIYSMGVIMYEMLTGRLPFVGSNFTEIIVSILTDPPFSPAKANPLFPATAEPVLMRVLDKDPSKRFQNSAEFIEALKLLEGFTQRQENLTALAATASRTTFAAGSLGENIDTSKGSKNMASDILSQVALANTPAGWSKTSSSKNSSSKKKQNNAIIAVIALAGLISIGGAIALVSSLNNNETPATAATTQRPAPQTDVASSVSINVTGTPPNSRIFYNDMLVTINPYRVKKSQTPAIIKVVADGFSPFQISLIPSRDQEIPVSLTPQK